MSDMIQEKVKNRPSLFAASGFYLLAAIGMWLVMLVYGILTTGIPEIWSGITPEWENFLITAAYYLPFLILPIALWAIRRGDGERVLRLNPISFGTMLLTVIMAILCLILVQNITMLWMIPLQKLGLNVFQNTYVRPANTGELTLSVLGAAFITPVAEEFLFRGVMLSAWERRGMRSAVWTTAILFAMLHGSVVGLPGEIFGGVMMAMLVILTDSIYAGLVFHTVYNASVALTNYVSSAVQEEAAQIALMETDIVAYLGGFETILMMLLEIVMLLVIVGSILRFFAMGHVLRRMRALIQEKPELAKNPMAIHPGKLLGEPKPAQRERLSIGTILVLMAGIVSALSFYIIDLISMLGG